VCGQCLAIIILWHPEGWEQGQAKMRKQRFHAGRQRTQLLGPLGIDGAHMVSLLLPKLRRIIKLSLQIGNGLSERVNLALRCGKGGRDLLELLLLALGRI
jgi:hypothetical protein